MGTYRALVAKRAPDGFRESLARFRADRPPKPTHVCRANPEPVFGPRRAGEEATSPRAVTSTQPSSRHRSAVHRQSLGFQLQCRAEHPDAPRRSRQVCCTPRHTWAETALERRRVRVSPRSDYPLSRSFSTNPGADLGQQGGIPERGPLRPSYPQGPLSHDGGNAGILCYRTKIELALAMSSPVSGMFLFVRSRTRRAPNVERVVHGQ
jgi:hypothetical protein